MICHRQSWLFFFLLILPGWVCAQTGVPDSILNDKDARWMVLLAFSDQPFTSEQVSCWQRIAKRPLKIYKNTEGEYRAVVEAPSYWVQSLNYRDSLIAQGVSEAQLVKLYANRFSHINWGQLVDFGTYIE